MFGLKGREHYEGYVANEYIEGLAIFPRESEPVIVTWHPKMIIRRMGSKTDQDRFWIKDWRTGPYGKVIAAVLKERGLDRASIGVVGLEVGEAGSPEGIVPHTTYRRITEALPAARFSEATWWLREIMLVKSPEELAVLRYCGRLGERACQAMIDTVRIGASEFTIYQVIQEAIHGGGGVPHDPFLIMTWGKDDIGWAEPAWGYFGGPPRRVEPGDLIMAELFPSYGGLETQQQMSVAVAPVEPIIAELGDVAARCYDAGIATLRAGKTFSDVWGAMLEPLKQDQRLDADADDPQRCAARVGRRHGSQRGAAAARTAAVPQRNCVRPWRRGSGAARGHVVCVRAERLQGPPAGQRRRQRGRNRRRAGTAQHAPQPAVRRRLTAPAGVTCLSPAARQRGIRRSRCGRSRRARNSRGR